MEINRNRIIDITNYTVESIKHICKNIPPREPGSEGERQAEEYMAKEIMNGEWADDTAFQEFTVAPKAFMGFTRVIPVLILIGTILFWFTTWSPLVFSIAGLIVLILEFVLYKPFLDFFYPKKKSCNMIARKKPIEEIKKRIIFSGHADAAYEWTLFYKYGPLVHGGGQIIAAIFLLISITMSVIAILQGYAPLWGRIMVSCFIIGYIPLFFFSNYKRVVPGANDNLTGCLVSLGVLKYLKEENINLNNTEVICAIMGSEEAGLRGSKAFANAYYNEFNNPDIETIYIGLETFREVDHLTVYAKDLSGTIKHSPKVISILDRASERLYGKPLKHSSVYLGATDAAAMTVKGLHATTLGSMDPAPARYYHTRDDNEDNLNPDCIVIGFEMALTALDIFDRD